ncbi:hypothetical protein BD414DRAFT_498672 [Trametes punicea]|nr:hypothetical protein BD414DRAFT_498672 [Trametes punicea]
MRMIVPGVSSPLYLLSASPMVLASTCPSPEPRAIRAIRIVGVIWASHHVVRERVKPPTRDLTPEGDGARQVPIRLGAQWEEMCGVRLLFALMRVVPPFHVNSGLFAQEKALRSANVVSWRL